MDDVDMPGLESECARTPPRPVSNQVPVVFEKESHEKQDMDNKDEECFGCIVAQESKPELEAALKSLGLTVVYSPDGQEIPEYVPDECDMVFVCEEFEGHCFDYLHTEELRIVGPTCVFSHAEKGMALPHCIQPVYNDSMRDVTICFTGFKDKQELHHIDALAHYMRARILNSVSSAVTHVVAHTVGGSKYKVGVVLGTAIMSDSWIIACWERRHEVGLHATDSQFSQYKQLPFTGCVIALHGFPGEEEAHMREIATSNGAQVNEFGSSSSQPTTHLVVCDEMDPFSISHTSSRVHVVKQQWFWDSIQIEACADERLYQAKESHYFSCSPLKSSLLTSINNEDIVCLLDALLAPPVATPTSTGAAASSHSATGTARRHIASELLQTEKNFVNILSVIVNVFKELLVSPQQKGSLSHEDMKSIFGNIPEILAVHQQLVSGLEEQLSEWSEMSCIGQVLLQQSEGFLRVYPPFVNFFDMSKEALHKCDKLYPRFHGFLKSNESRAECSQQTLAELLITPIQRISRIFLFVQDLVKHTDPAHPDHSALQHTVESLRTVMTRIKEDRKRKEGRHKTRGQL